MFKYLKREFIANPIKMIAALIALGAVISWITTDTLRRYDEDTVSAEEKAKQAEYDKYCNSEKDKNADTCIELMKKRFNFN